MKLSARLNKVAFTTRESRTLRYSLFSIQAFGVKPFFSKAAFTFYNCILNQRIFYIQKAQQQMITILIDSIVIMDCINDYGCPHLYYCNEGLCKHQPITHISPQLVISILLTPFLTTLSNRIGISTIWIIYPIVITIMGYQFKQSFQLIVPLSLAASFLMLYLTLKQKSEQNGGPAINFYIVSIAMPMLILSTNIGLVLSKLIPFLYISIVGIIFLTIFMYIGYVFMKDVKANQKINIGHFRKMLPPRIQNSQKSNLSIQLALIKQADSQIQQHEREMSPTRKSRIRNQLLSSFEQQFPTKLFIVILLSFLCYECICVSFPEAVSWLGIDQKSQSILISYSVILLLVLLGEVYIYKFFVQPQKIKEQAAQLNLGVRMSGMKAVKICLTVMLGGILQGMIGFGLSFSLFFYLLHSKMMVKDAIATCGFLNIFISSIFSLFSIFCDEFHWVSFVVLFVLIILITSGAQYFVNSYIDSTFGPQSLNSKLMIILIFLLIICSMSLILGVTLNWVKFGWQSIGATQDFQKC